MKLRLFEFCAVKLRQEAITRLTGVAAREKMLAFIALQEIIVLCLPSLFYSLPFHLRRNRIDNESYKNRSSSKLLLEL